MKKKETYHLALVAGSTRTEREGIKVVRWFNDKLKERGHNVDFIDLQNNPLPMLDLMYKEYDKGKAPKLIEECHKVLKKADGYIFVTPEYNHSVSAVLKNFLDHYQSEYFFKPAGIVSYSTGGFGGIRAAEQLRLILIELGMVPTPISFPVSKVSDTFAEPGQPVPEKKESLDTRVEKFFSEYEWYLAALKNQRAQGTPY